MKLNIKKLVIGILMLFVTVYIPVQSVSAAETQSADSAGVYVFQDAKKEGTVTVINLKPILLLFAAPYLI